MALLFAIVIVGYILLLAGLSSTLDEMDVSEINVDNLWMTYFALQEQL